MEQSFMELKEEEYSGLIDRVRKIDSKAADYMQSEARALLRFSPGVSLLNCFAWSDTPQGRPYWKALDATVEKL